MLIVPKLNPNTPTLMDGEVRLFKRKHSKVWQIAFTLDGRQVRVSSKKRILNDAVAAAREIYLDYRFRQKNGLPVISKRFADVAALCRATMKQQLENGVGKKSFRDYIIVIDKYLVPFFGDIFVTSIDYEMLQKFARWREAKMGREPRSSTLNTHNSALNRIFDEAVARGYMKQVTSACVGKQEVVTVCGALTLLVKSMQLSFASYLAGLMQGERASHVICGICCVTTFSFLPTQACGMAQKQRTCAGSISVYLKTRASNTLR